MPRRAAIGGILAWGTALAFLASGASAEEGAEGVTGNPGALALVASGAGALSTRLDAVERLEDPRWLVEVAQAVNARPCKRYDPPSDDTKVAALALRKLEARRLAEVALGFRGDPKEAPGCVGREAIALIADPELLASLATGPHPELTRGVAVSRLADQPLLARIALQDPSRWVRNRAAEKVTDEAVLIQLAQDPWDGIRRTVVDRLSDAPTLARLALGDPNPWIREAALRFKMDQAVLAQVAIGDSSCEVQKKAAFLVRDPSRAADVAIHATCEQSRREALGRLTDAVQLARVAAECTDDRVSLAALEEVRSDDPALYARIAAAPRSKPVVRIAAYRLVGLSDDRDVLARFAGEGPQVDEADALAATARFKLLLREEPLASRFPGVRVRGTMARIAAPYRDLSFQGLGPPPSQLVGGESVTLSWKGDGRAGGPWTFKAEFPSILADPAPPLLPAKIQWDLVFRGLFKDLALQDAEWERLARSGFGVAEQEAARRMESPDALARLALGARDSSARRVAASRIQDEGLLARIAREAKGCWLTEDAVARLTDPELLRSLAGGPAACDSLRRSARLRLEELKEPGRARPPRG